jgi:hypothetical protein
MTNAHGQVANGDDFGALHSSVNTHILPSTRTANAGGGDPTSYWEATNSALEDWVTIMKEEMDALAENDM